MFKKIKFSSPDTYVLIFFIVVIFAAITYFIPTGKFEAHNITYTAADGTTTTKQVIIPDSFKLATNAQGKPLIQPTPIFNAQGGSTGLTNYVFEGTTSGDKWGSAVGIVVFILVIGGALGIVLKTGAIEAGILSVISKVKGREIVIIPITFIIFSLGGALFGWSEECIAFSAVIIPLVIAIGYDSITAILISFGASQVGYATSPLNPFCSMIAQGIAGVPVLSGANFRWLMFIIFTAFGIIYAIIYAQSIKKNPHKSLAFASDDYFRQDLKEVKQDKAKVSRPQMLILIAILACFTWIVWGVLASGYLIPQIATIFFIMGLSAGIIAAIFKVNGMTINGIAEAFRNGVKDLAGAAMVVGMAKGILLVLGGSDPTIPTVLNTLLHYSANGLSHLPTIVSAWGMYIFQLLMRFLIVSTSGQAAFTMPLMAPLALFIGLSKQIAVLCYQLSNFGGIVFPTDAGLLGVLAVAKLDWTKWAKSQIKFQLLLSLGAFIFILIAVKHGFN
jgi:uncharacterized ion transporter superfamily protein YfcC